MAISNIDSADMDLVLNYPHPPKIELVQEATDGRTICASLQILCDEMGYGV
jgi:hypothetical protein